MPAAQVCYPKRTDKPLFHSLVAQCEAHNIAFVEPNELPAEPGKLSDRADVVLDALFGFSFKVQGVFQLTPQVHCYWRVGNAHIRPSCCHTQPRLQDCAFDCRGRRGRRWTSCWM